MATRRNGTESGPPVVATNGRPPPRSWSPRLHVLSADDQDKPPWPALLRRTALATAGNGGTSAGPDPPPPREPTMVRHLAAILAADVVGFTRLMGGGDAAAIDLVLTLWQKTLRPLVEAEAGRLVSRTGDGFLVEFPSAGGALECALAWQDAVRAAEAATGDGLHFRIGIALGDVFAVDTDVFGKGVITASRLEQLCPPDGVLISDAVRAVAPERRGVCFTDLGERRLKNLDRPVRVWLVERIDLGDVAPQLLGAADIRYCRAADGVSLATCAVGEGAPLMLAGSWFTHLQKDWQSPWAHYLRALVQSFRVIRYDQRGTGMSDWDVPEITFEQLVDDLETVVAASGHERVALYGANQAASVALAFAHRCPGRVSRLVLRSGYARGRRRRGNAEEVAESEALVTLIRKGWGSSNPAFRQLMASIFMPDAGPDEIAWFSAFQRETAPAANAARVREVFDNVDVSPLLPEIRVPVLVLHPSGDPAAPVSEGKLMAATIPGARFVLFDCDNHMLFENDPEFPRILATLRAFLA